MPAGNEMSAGRYLDPMALKDWLWPTVYFYDKQREVIYSVVNNTQTFVHAGHQLGKDFVTAFIVLWFFLTRRPCRIITTSVDATQLEGVLWGEIYRFIDASKIPLDSRRGGPLIINHLHIRRASYNDKGKSIGRCKISYIQGRVAAKGEGMQGHHAYPVDWDGVTPHTLFVADEASGVDDIVFERADSWAKRMLVIGNPYPTDNFFYQGVEGGDIVAEA